MQGKIKYKYSARMWKHHSYGGWHFVTLPKDLSKEIRENLKFQEEAWGRMKVMAQIEDTTWETAIWFDTKMETYVLPIKAEIRKKEKIEIDQVLDIKLWI